jgi:hypothetical protein
VKRTLAFILLNIYLFSFSELHQFLKIPILVQHFVEHRALEPGTTFWGFMKEHYQGKFEMDEDYQRDNQLPFRTADCISNSFVAYEIPATIEIQPQEFEERAEFVIINENEIPHRATTDIFQPPRFS